MMRLVQWSFFSRRVTVCDTGNSFSSARFSRLPPDLLVLQPIVHLVEKAHLGIFIRLRRLLRALGHRIVKLDARLAADSGRHRCGVDRRACGDFADRGSVLFQGGSVRRRGRGGPSVQDLAQRGYIEARSRDRGNFYQLSVTIGRREK